MNTKKAEADLAYELQASKQQQLIVSEKLNVDLGKAGFIRKYLKPTFQLRNHCRFKSRRRKFFEPKRS